MYIACTHVHRQHSIIGVRQEKIKEREETKHLLKCIGRQIAVRLVGMGAMWMKNEVLLIWQSKTSARTSSRNTEVGFDAARATGCLASTRDEEGKVGLGVCVLVGAECKQWNYVYEVAHIVNNTKDRCTWCKLYTTMYRKPIVPACLSWHVARLSQ